MVKQNCQVVRFVDFGQMNEFMVQNSSPTCQHNLFTLIQIKKMFFKYLAMLKSSKRLRVSELPCAHSSKTAEFLSQCNLFQMEFHNDFGISVVLTYDIHDKISKFGLFDHF